jgi:starch synthase (maltosyl-transferring)
MLPAQMLRRVIVEAVTPQVDEGRYPAKRTFGEDVIVEADVYADGHDVVAATLLWRRRGDTDWEETPMRALGNDRFRGSFFAGDEFDTFEFTVEGWIDLRATW